MKKGFALLLACSLLFSILITSSHAETIIGKVRILKGKNSVIRVNASTEANELGIVYSNSQYDLLEIKGEWYKILTNDNIVGWISASKAEIIVTHEPFTISDSEKASKSPSTPKPTKTPKPTSTPKKTSSSSKSTYEKLNWKGVSRNPSQYTGRKVKFRGKVLQVMESFSTYELRIATSGNYDDVVYVIAEMNKVDGGRILEDDTVFVYGEYDGIKTYTAVLGNSISIPLIQAYSVTIQ